MASEAEASCESDPNFAIICAFLEKFGELCGIGSIDFVELQSMLENNQEVSPELMNLHIKLLRKTKKNVTVERWERALVNMCHNYSSKDAWEIERFGYKKTRLQIKLRALKELLEMQFDYNTKFKNEVNKMTAESLRPQPLGRDKLGRAYWFQTDNNYQIRIYKEDPDEETWHLVAKDRDGLLSLMNELADGDSKLSSDSALNEDSNSLSEKPFIDTGQSQDATEKIIEQSESDSTSNPEPVVAENQKETESEEIVEKSEEADAESKSSESKGEEPQDVEKKMDVESSDDDEEETEEKQDAATESEEVKRPMLRIKSLSELMEKPEETRKTNFIPDLPELTIIKKAKLDSSQITITRTPRDQQNPKEIEVSPVTESPPEGYGSGDNNDSCDVTVSEEIEEPVMVVSGEGSGEDCQAGNEKRSEEERSVVEKSEEMGKNQEDIFVSEEIEEEVMFIFGEGSGRDCEAGNETTQKPEKTNIKEEEIIVSEEIEEEVMFIVGEGSGVGCMTGNEKEQTTTQETEKSKNADSPNKVPIDRVNVDTIKDSKTETETRPDTDENPREENASPKKTQFFFGPGSLNIKPCPVSPVINANASEEATMISGNNGSIPEENSENKKEKSEDEEVNNEAKDSADNVGKVPEENPVTEDKVPSSECSKPQDPEEETNVNPPEDPGKEEIEAEDAVDEPENDVNSEEAKTGIEDTETPKVQNEEEKCEDDNSQANESSQTEESSSKQENSEENEESRVKETVVEDSKKNEDNAESTTDERVQEDNETEIEEEKSQSSEELVKKDEETSEKKDENKISEPVSESIEKVTVTESEEPNDAKNEEIEETPDKQENKENATSKNEDKVEKLEDEEKPKEIEDETEERDEAGVESDKGEEESDKVEEEVDDVEKPEVESDEKEENSKNQGAASKRKRVTRNTAVLNESITEEDMNPRKKVPVEKTKKKGPQKVTKPKNEDEEEQEEQQAESSSKVETNEPRTTRQTRQTRSLVLPKAQTPAGSAKAKGKANKKTASSPSKSDDAESPKPLESVTIVDTDNSSTAVENPEKDPLAVSEEEVAPAVPSITSFSFDYNPNSPAPEETKRSMRKRGRDNLEDKPEVPDKEVKRPKIRGKRTMVQSLRKSVEEKRQLVGDGSSDENEPKKKGNKKTPVKKKAGTPSVSDSDNASQKSEVKAKRGSAKNTRILKNLGVREEDVSSLTDSPAPVRQSRRIAQIKIKEEATRRRVDDDEVSSKKKKKKSDDKDFKVGKRKRIEEEVKPVPTPPMVEKKKKRKTKQNKISIGWKSSSEDSDNSCQEEEEVSEYEEHHEEEPLQFKSDHEFSPESDLECDEPLPLKRARTVRKEESNDDEEPEEEFPCQKCGKSDHPEWILLCDKCDNGWHCSCLRPALFVIPEGDWYCPTCQHETLMENLNKKLIEFDKMIVKKEMEDRRKERLAYVGISLNNVLPAKEKKDKKTDKSYDSEESSKENTPSASDSEESDSDEPIYQLRQRRQAHSYKFQDYDDLINSALQEEPAPEVEKTHTLGRGKDIATIVNAAKEEEEKNGFEDLPPVVPRDPEENRKKAISYRKKPKRLNNLEVNSDDEADDSDEDFKGSSSDESDEEEYTEDSDDSFVGKKSSRPVRRSTRARTTRYDADFINDDSDEAPLKKKKKKRYFSDSESSLSDDWRGKKKKSGKKSKKKKKMFDDSDLENYRKKKPKIKYGMDSEDDTRGRRTRGKKTSYLDTLGSDSEEETLKKKIRDKSDDEYVAEDDEEKESEEEKPSGDEDDDDEHPVKPKKHKSEESDSENETLVVKKVKLKTKRTIMDSEEEEEEEEDDDKKDEIVKKTVEEPPKTVDKNQVINEELAKTVREFEEQVPTKELITEPKLPVVQPEETQKPSVVPGLNVEKLKACGITVTKVAKDKAGLPPSETPNKLIEIGAKPVSNRVPVNLTKIEKSLDELDEDEVEEMMENEEYANRQLELAAIQIREAKRMKQELEKKEQQPPLTITRKPTDMIPKKQGTGRFFNMKPSPEPMLGNSSMLMNDDDNDELSEPPGVTLPLFSELGAMKVHNLSKSNNRSPLNNTPPPPPSPNRAVPVPLHNMGLPHPSTGMVPPNPFGSPRGMMHHMRLTRPMGPRVGNMPPMMGPRVPMPPMEPINQPMRLNVPGNIPNVPRNMNVPPPPIGNSIPMGTSPPLPISSSNVPTGPGLPPMGVVASVAATAAVPTGLNMTMASNLTMGSNAASPNVTPGSGGPGHGANVATFNESPDGTPKKRRGRGKGKKTLAAEAAAAAAAAAGLPEANKIGNNAKPPPAANIEIASPPQPFSQSQPAPSVITRMLQTTAGKGAFPVGRIRPKQFAMMQDSDDSQSPRPSETQEKDMSTHPAPTSHPPVSAPHGGHPPGHYGPPTGQYPPNYDQAQPPHGYHHQRPPPPPMHPYPPHPSQPPMDAPPMNPPIHQPPISIADSPSLAQYSAPPPPPSKSPYEGMPPHRPPYQSAGAGYNYDYNVPPPVMSEEGVVPPAAYENPTVYPDQYETGSSGVDPKIVEEETSGEFGGLVSYFSSQHEDDLEQ
ncbi:remodeling and spacing factor 1 [Coccinella septempunctata]|uniref:remodeling and spacing factor 1 n=1 Tax=Coccinella septempunctata TaxID=41139 RepID=UPI001D080FD2|nr:remodeling and spacing factor 1 [Coccinella septempunctata]